MSRGGGAPVVLLQWRDNAAVFGVRWIQRLARVVLAVLVASAGVPMWSAAVGAASDDVEGVTVSRHYGADRYETSLRVAEAVAAEAGGSLTSVVLVSGERWTDAVVAAPIAGSLGAPVLMTPPGALSTEALAFLERVGVSNAVVVGPDEGGGAHGPGRGVKAAVLTQLAAADISAERVDGAGRFGTSVEVAGEITPGAMPGFGRTAIVASADVFTDALVAGPFAARGIHPVLLSAPDALAAEVSAYLSSADIEHVVLMGGIAALSSAVETAIKDLGVKVTRLAGETRYDTAVKSAELVAARYSTAGGKACFATSTVGLARARVPFDSFSAAPLLGRLCASLVLADPKRIPADTAAFLDTARDEHDRVDLRVFGGDAAVSQEAIDAYLTGERTEPSAAPGVLPAGTCGGSIDDEPIQLVPSTNAEDPAWSPDCSQLVYTESGALWLVDHDGANRRQLVPRAGGYRHSAVWSPLGDRIAYVNHFKNSDGHWTAHIWTANADGSHNNQRTEGDVQDTKPSWSPDGTRIAFERYSGTGRDQYGNFENPTSRILVASTDRNSLAALTSSRWHSSSWHSSPAWSPDGRRIAYVYEGAIWLMDHEGMNAEPAIGNAFSGGGLSWSPDGRRIAFVRGDRSRSAIIVADVNGLNEEVVYDEGLRTLAPRWSPDGQRIAFHTIDTNGEHRTYVTGASGTPTGVGAGCRPRGVEHTTAGFPLPTWAAPSKGKLRVAALFMDFPDAQASHTTREEGALGLPYLEEFLESSSYGLLDVEVKPHHVWLRAAAPYAKYVFTHPSDPWARPLLNQEATKHAVELADDEVDFSTADLILVAFPGSHFGGGQLGGTVQVDGVEIATVRVNSIPFAESGGSAWLHPWGFAGAHEIIHALGLPDLVPSFFPELYDRSMRSDNKRWINAKFGPMNLLSWFPAHRNDSRLQYDRTNPDGSTQRDFAMQLHALEMLAWSRWQLGWLNDSQVRCIEDGDNAATVALTPIAQPGDGVAMAAIQLSSHEVVVVESRRRLGYDSAGPHPVGLLGGGTAQKLATEGVLVYTVDTLRGSGWLPARVVGGNDNLEHDDFPVLQVGDSVTVAGYTISVTADSGDTHTVTIERGD